MITIKFDAIGYDTITVQCEYADLLDTIKHIENEYVVETLTYVA